MPVKSNDQQKKNRNSPVFLKLFLRNCRNWTIWFTSSTVYTLITNFISHRFTSRIILKAFILFSEGIKNERYTNTKSLTKYLEGINEKNVDKNNSECYNYIVLRRPHSLAA